MIWRGTGRPRLGYPPCSTIGSPPGKRRHEIFRARRHEKFRKYDIKYSEKDDMIYSEKYDMKYSEKDDMKYSEKDDMTYSEKYDLKYIHKKTTCNVHKRQNEMFQNHTKDILFTKLTNVFSRFLPSCFHGLSFLKQCKHR